MGRMWGDEVRTYCGLTIDRSFPSGYWVALGPSGYLKADTLAGLKALIRHTLGEDTSKGY